MHEDKRIIESKYGEAEPEIPKEVLWRQMAMEVMAKRNTLLPRVEIRPIIDTNELVVKIIDSREEYNKYA